jgi:hypothetical protein
VVEGLGAQFKEWLEAALGKPFGPVGERS